MRPPLRRGLAAFGISHSGFTSFVNMLQGVMDVGVGSSLLSLSPGIPEGRVAALSLLHLRFVCRVAVDGDMAPI